MRRKLFHVVFGFVLGATIIPAQEGAINGNPVVDTPLQDHHIALTKDALLTALRNPVPGVRSAAALVLAAHGEKDAVPSILEALATETFQGTRISLASAAAELGADDGIAALRSMCGNTSWSAGLRMSAAWAMILRGREDCLGNVLDVIRFHDDSQAVVAALNFLPRFKHVPAQEMQEIRNLVRMSLRSGTPWVRREASSALRQWGDAAALEELRSALAVESDDTVRAVVAGDLKSLEEKQANPIGKAK